MLANIKHVSLPIRHTKLKTINDFIKGDVSPYLIKWYKEHDEKFEWRTKVSYYQDYVSPIVNGLTGLIFSKEHKIDIDELYIDNVDLMGTNIYKFLEVCTKNAIQDGLTFIVADTNVIDINDTLANSNLRGYLKNFSYAQLINYKIRDGKIIQIVFKESIDIDIEDDDYKSKTIDRYIRYFIGGGEIYHDDDANIELVSSWSNLLNEIPISLIHGGFDNIGLDVESILYKIVNLNKSHYNLKSGLMNISHIASNPTPVIWGLPSNSTQSTMSIGVNAVVEFPTNQGKAYDFQWREITGNGVAVAEREIKELEEYIIASSFNILKVDNFTTATEAKLNSSKNKNILTSIVKSLELALHSSLSFLEELTNTKIAQSIILNKDFDNLTMSPEIIKSIIDMRDKGNISLDTLWDALIKGEVIEIEDFEIEKDKLKDELSIGL